MTIGVMHILLDEKVSGVPINILRTTSTLDRKEFRPVVVIPNGNDRRFARMLEAEGVPVEEMNLRRIRASYDPRPQFRWLANLPGAVGMVRQVIRDYQVDLVHAYGLTQVTGAFAARLCGKPIVWHLMSDGEPWFIKRLFLPLVWRMSDRVAVYSHGWATSYLGAAAHSPRVAALACGVDIERFRPGLAADSVRAEFGMRPGQIWLCQVGNPHPLKGQHVLIEATAIARRRSGLDIRALIVGRLHNQQLAYNDGLQARIVQLGLQEEIILTGLRDDIPAILNAVGISIVPSLTESFGIAAVEAMACELPVLASRIGGLPEVLEDGVTGLLVTPGNADILADHIIRLARDPNLRRQLGVAGRERAERCFSPRTIASQYEKVYRQVLAERQLLVKGA
jgi:glycosyltransferase involved in cell wall biosynthesis